MAEDKVRDTFNRPHLLQETENIVSAGQNRTLLHETP